MQIGQVISDQGIIVGDGPVGGNQAAGRYRRVYRPVFAVEEGRA